MKLLIRTITLGALMFFMTMVVLHCTIVGTIRQEIDAASVNALYRTIDAYEENQKMIAEGDTSNLYFSTDDEYYYYYYDSFMVQLNGNLKVVITCNETNVDTGDLDIDITATYKGVGTKEREHTVHVDTYGKINTIASYTDEQKLMNERLAVAPIGKKIKWADHNWVLVSDQNDTATLLLDEDIGSIVYGSDEEYKNSNLESKMIDFGNNVLGKTNLEYLENAALNNMDTFNGVHTYNGTDEISGKVFALSTKQAIKLSASGYSTNFWLRTSSGTNEVYAYKVGVSDIESFDKKLVTESLSYRPAVNIVKSKFASLTEDGEYYVLNTSDTKISWDEDPVDNVGWDDRNDKVLQTINSLDTGVYKLSAVVSLSDITNTNEGDQYGMKLDNFESMYSYSQVIVNNPNYFEMEFTVKEKGQFSDLRLYGSGNSVSGKTGTANFFNIKITRIGEVIGE